MPEKAAVSLPSYVKVTCIAILVLLLFYVISIGQGILLPLGFAFLLSILLHPVEKWLHGKGIPRVISIIVCLFIFILVIFLLASFVSQQVTALADDFPRIRKSMNELWEKSQVWMYEKLNISYSKQEQMAENAKNEAVNVMAPATLNILTVMLVLLPVYIFLILFYRNVFLQFLVEIFQRHRAVNVREIINDVRLVVQQFITGVLFETSIVATLNVTGLLIIGAPYAILLGVLGAIINMIPYIGGIVQLILSGLIVYSNNNSLAEMFWTMGILLLVQGIDNYLLMPRIVGSRVKLNGLVSIIGVLTGGAIAGLGGMFLSIPFLAITKTIFDRVEDMKPWGKLLGAEMSTAQPKKSRKKAGG
jgi:predicted PurR-regulated permease PerM